MKKIQTFNYIMCWIYVVTTICLLGLPFHAANDIPVEPPVGDSGEGHAQGSVMLFTNKSNDTSYYKWMIVLTGGVVVLALIQTGCGVSSYRRRKRREAARLQLEDSTSTGSTYDTTDLSRGIDHVMFRSASTRHDGMSLS